MLRVFLFLCFCFFTFALQAQTRSKEGSKSLFSEKEFSYPKAVRKTKYNIAVFSPMYLDSIDLEKNLTHLPKPMLQGLDFYKGVEIAADTLNKLGLQLDIHVFDSKSDTADIRQLLGSEQLDTMDLLIANLGVADLKLLADFAKRKQINLISATSPADAGQTANPYFTILQPRLVSHIEKMHRSINYRYPEDNVVFINRNIAAERNALAYFKNDIMNSIPGRFAEMELLGDELDMKQVFKRIDTNYNTTIILGMLDPAVTYKNLKLILPFAKQYGIKVYCMPTSESMKSLGKTDEFPMMPVYYTIPYVIDKITPSSLFINREYRSRMGGYASDYVYKGFESLYFFANLMKKYGVPFNTHISDNAYSFITPYKIVPVKENGLIKFYENKYLYIVRYENGIMTYE